MSPKTISQRILDHKGSISHKAMEEQVAEVYEKFAARRKKSEVKLADDEDLKELEQLAGKVIERGT